MEAATTITVHFFKEVSNWGEITLREITIDTKKTTITEAYQVAIANGANPRKLIEYIINK